MSNTREFVSTLQERLRALDEERAHLLKMLELHGAPEGNGAAHGTPGRPQRRGQTSPRSAKKPAGRARRGQPQREAPFEPIPGGPTQSIIKVLASAPEGLTYSEILEQGARIVKTHAKNPRDTIAGSIYLKKRGKIVLNNGRYSLPA
jgi:hypothetical protein